MNDDMYKARQIAENDDEWATLMQLLLQAIISGDPQSVDWLAALAARERKLGLVRDSNGILGFR